MPNPDIEFTEGNKIRIKSYTKPCGYLDCTITHIDTTGQVALKFADGSTTEHSSIDFLRRRFIKRLEG